MASNGPGYFQKGPWNESGYWQDSSLLGMGVYTSDDLQEITPEIPRLINKWLLMSFMVLLAVSPLLWMYIFISWTPLGSLTHPKETREPPTVSNKIPLVGSLISYLTDAAGLARSITEQFGASSIVRLRFLTKDIYVVSGAKYLNTIWRSTKGLTSTNGINIALSNMFDTPGKDMKFFEADDSGITYDPHPQSSRRPEDRVFYLMHKATVACLAGSHLTLAAQSFQRALEKHMDAVPIGHEWADYPDLFDFLRPLISHSTVEAMCGSNFVSRFPDFVQDFWRFNSSMPKLLQGWPRWAMPGAWRARDLCIEVMKQWRNSSDEQTFTGNAMIPRRWSYFSKMKRISTYGVACSDLGILWGMNSNSMPTTFWLFWHMIQDRDVLSRATSKVSACAVNLTSRDLDFDTPKLCSQPLLQSCYAETLRLYVAVYIIRKPEHQDARILDYNVPKKKMMVISSAIAHMDQRNWNLGHEEQHPVETFWADRFLRPRACDRSESATNRVTSTGAEKTASGPQFSMNSYSRSWIPFGGGIHQCPGRHWVKLQMLLSFAMMPSTFYFGLRQRSKKPRLDMGKYGLGALQPSDKSPFRIRRKPKRCEAWNIYSGSNETRVCKLRQSEIISQAGISTAFHVWGYEKRVCSSRLLVNFWGGLWVSWGGDRSPYILESLRVHNDPFK